MSGRAIAFCCLLAAAVAAVPWQIFALAVDLGAVVVSACWRSAAAGGLAALKGLTGCQHCREL